MGSDAMILIPKVEVFKDEKGETLEDSFVVSVLTCAAPDLRDGIQGMSQQEYEDMLYGRILKMLQCAAYWGYKFLVLGAYLLHNVIAESCRVKWRILHLQNGESCRGSCKASGL
jgi:uncharacterized protein (TIGR02452 family)